jgi:hypothetical protein
MFRGMLLRGIHSRRYPMSKNLFSDPFSLIVITIIACGFLYAFYYQWKVRTRGIEADAVVTWLEEKEHSDSDGVSYYYDVHVSYMTKDGRDIDGILSNPGSYEEGEHIRIKYLPGNEEYPVCVERL